jgi:hypothetical protein
MSDARHDFSAISLADGSVLASGGHNDQLGSTLANHLSSADIYDPATGLWTPTPPMAVVRAHHETTLLPDGRLLTPGGLVCCNVGTLSSAEIFGGGV